MTIYTTTSSNEAKKIRHLIGLNSECARLQWLRSFPDLPDNVSGALETIGSFVDAYIRENCEFFDELNEDEEQALIELVHSKPDLKETLGAGVITSGAQADEVISFIGSDAETAKLSKAIKTNKNVILF